MKAEFLNQHCHLDRTHQISWTRRTWLPEIGGIEWDVQSWTTKWLTEAAVINDIITFADSSMTSKYQLCLVGSLLWDNGFYPVNCILIKGLLVSSQAVSTGRTTRQQI